MTSQQPLLGPGDPPPVRVLNETGGSAFFLTADHAGRALPRKLGRLGLTEADLDRHIAWDIGIAGVTGRLSETLGATAVLQTYSRLAIDCNRDPSWPSAFPVISETTDIPGNAGLLPADKAARVAAIFKPYHDRITALLDARAAAGRRSILVAMHSFTPVYKGQFRPMQTGVLHFGETRMASIMLDLLRAEDGLTVGDNEPYAITANSDYSAPTHGDRRGLTHVEIEIRQDLIAGAAGQTVWAARFSRLLPEALRRLG